MDPGDGGRGPTGLLILAAAVAVLALASALGFLLPGTPPGAGEVAGVASALLALVLAVRAHQVGKGMRRREADLRASSQLEVQASEAQLADVLDHAHDLIHSTDAEGRILYANEAWKRRLGYPDPEGENLRIHDLVHPDDLALFEKATERVFQGEELSGVEFTLVARDGSSVFVSGSSNCRMENGRPVATRTILRDLSAERTRERELAQLDANLRAVFESTGDPIWSVDSEGRLVTFNMAFALLLEVITGAVPKQGDPPGAIMGEEGAAWFHAAYARALEGVRFSDVREEEVDGEHRIFELFFNPIETLSDGVTGVVVFAHDATRRLLAEADLRAARKAAEEASASKSEFLASMSHELRTPLNSIIGFSNLLLRGPADVLADRDRGFLERIQVNGKHLLSLINEILDLSKIEAGHMELAVEEVDLAPLVRETLAQIESEVVGKELALRAEIPGHPSPIRTDRARLKQVLLNLVANALKFTESGEVVVAVDVEDDGQTPYRIRVRDTGIGIPEDRLEAIFQAFEQADSGTTRRFGGTGLGLAISRSISALLGFDLTVASEVGKGSEFTLTLVGIPGEEPADGDEEGGRAAEGKSALGARLPGLERTLRRPLPSPRDGLAELEGAAPEPGRWNRVTGSADTAEGVVARAGGAELLAGKTVLVVDDEEDSRTLLRLVLEELGCRVLTAGDGAEGLDMARAEVPDLITLDLMMPRMTGWEMLRDLRDDPTIRDIPVVVVSLVARESGRPILGSVDLLPKPVDREDLLPVLFRNLDRSGARLLVVDPHPASRLLVTRYLRDAGFQVHAVENGYEGLQYLKRVPVELILTDLNMPVMDGFTFIRRLRETPAFAEVPVVVLATGQILPDEQEVLDRAGVQVIQKGGQVEARLVQALDRVFRQDPDGTTHGATPGATPGATDA